MMYCFGLFLVIFLCYFISIFGIVVVNAVNYNKGHEGRLIDDLLVNNKYSKLERPVYDEAEALNITFKVELQQVIDLDERNQLLTTNLWLTYAWRDMNLIWDPVCDPFSTYVIVLCILINDLFCFVSNFQADYDGINETRIPPDRYLLTYFGRNFL